MTEPQKIRFISEEPKLAIALAKREKILLPKELYDYFVSWVEEIGALMRSREFLVSSIASYASYGVMLAVAKNFPITRRLGIISESLGIAE